MRRGEEAGGRVSRERWPLNGWEEREGGGEGEAKTVCRWGRWSS